MKRWLVLLALPACATTQHSAAKPPVVMVTTPVEGATEGELPVETCVPSPRPARPIRPPRDLPPHPDDPLAGHFDMADAIRDLSGQWPLRATLETNLGKLECTLWDEVAPRTVASFVGLARGLRPFRDPRSGEWRARPAYDGTTFHRVIRGFMIQGGDPTGFGSGEPGFLLPDEIDESVHTDRRGLLFMANRGPDTNGMQFFILDAPASHIDGRYTAFGECGPEEVIESIAQVQTGAGDRPLSPVTIERVRVAFATPCR